jgi:hypothetical protein
MKRYLQIVFVFLIVIFSFRFFEAKFIDNKLLNAVSFLANLISILLSIPFLFHKRKLFILPVQLIVGSIFFSILMSYISWGQSFANSFTETIPYSVWILFFYLLHTQISVKSIEKIILIYGVIYVVLYFFQLANSPKIFFGRSLWGDEFSVDRGIVRIVFPGGGIFVLAAFLALNKLTTQSKGRWFWLLFSLLGVIIPILQVTRLFIAGVVIIYLFHFLQKQSLYKKIMIMVVFIGIIFYVGNSNIGVISGLKEATKADEKLGENYIRIRSGTYFLTDFSPNLINQVFGNGVPYLNFSYYGLKLEQLNQKGYFLEDVGIIGMYAMFGILPVIAYILIWYKSFTIKLPKEYYYVKYYLWYLLITCLTTYYVYYPYFLISTVFALYIYQTIYERQEQLKSLLFLNYALESDETE